MARTHVWVKWWDGQRLTISQTAQRLGVTWAAVHARLQSGAPRNELLRPASAGRLRREPKLVMVSNPAPESRTCSEFVPKPESAVYRAINGELTADEYLQAEDEASKKEYDKNGEW